jgi:hypothetical protein
VKTVEPVVVKPDIASNIASVTVACGAPIRNGIAPKSGMATQTADVSRNVCWSDSRSRTAFAQATARRQPNRKVTTADSKNTVQCSFPAIRSATIGTTIVAPSAATRRPITYPTGRRSIIGAERWTGARGLSSAVGQRVGGAEGIARRRVRVARGVDVERQEVLELAAVVLLDMGAQILEETAHLPVAVWTSAANPLSPARSACQARQPKSSVPSPRPWWLSITVMATSAVSGRAGSRT